MDITLLGTAAARPTPDRNTSGVFVRDGRTTLLLDCGAGTIRALINRTVPHTLDAIAFTHGHTDHVGDFLNVVRYLGMNRTTPLRVYAPADLVHDLEYDVERISRNGEDAFPIEVVAVAPGQTLTVGELTVRPFATEHGIPSVGYRVEGPQRPGRIDLAAATARGIAPGPLLGQLKRGESVTTPAGDLVHPHDVVGPALPGAIMAYTGDTRPSPTVTEAVAGVDVLIHDATYRAADAALALKYHHSTAAEAGQVAARAGVRALVLTHLSGRYAPNTIEGFASDASVHFRGTILVGQDGLTLTPRAMDWAPEAGMALGSRLTAAVDEATAAQRPPAHTERQTGRV